MQQYRNEVNEAEREYRCEHARSAYTDFDLTLPERGREREIEKERKKERERERERCSCLDEIGVQRVRKIMRYTEVYSNVWACIE